MRETCSNCGQDACSGYEDCTIAAQARDLAALRSENERLRTTLHGAELTIASAGSIIEDSKVIADTLWFSDGCTLLDALRHELRQISAALHPPDEMTDEQARAILDEAGIDPAESYERFRATYRARTGRELPPLPPDKPLAEVTGLRGERDELRTALTLQDRELARLREALEIAAIRIGILRARMEACARGGENNGHEASLEEAPVWIAEARAALHQEKP